MAEGVSFVTILHTSLDLVLIFILVTTITLFTLLYIGNGRHKEISYS